MNQVISKRNTLLAVIGAGLATVLVGCSAPATEQMVIEGSMAVQYESSAQLAADSTLLVVGEVTGSTETKIENLIFTNYTFKVDKTLAGDAAEELSVYVVGAPGWQVSLDVPDYFKEGERYALFLRPTGLPKGSVGDDGYYIVGTGAWVESGDSTFSIWLDPAKNVDLAKIPTTFSEADIAKVLSADKVGTTK